MSYETILVEKRGGIGYLTLNRPDRANTINAQLGIDINAALDDFTSDGETRVIILTGAGRHFCGGADLRDMGLRSLTRQPSGLNFMSHIENVDLPVIAAINGAAMGGGCEIALCCDLRVMSEAAQIGLPEIRFGALPAGGGTQRLPRLLGPGKAKELIFTGLPLSASEALAIGLVNRIAPPGQLMATCTEIAGVLMQRAGYALAAAKFLINQGMQTDLETGLKLERRIINKMATPEEMAAERDRAAATQPTYANIFKESTRA
ncbi:MAG: enoyl-CoA hydratase/isomerase family protein [Thermoflexaceae bacterium]|nr:enoyl-CoA hydratase/isomerase family protein [Thermoflexaceae bacterium]